jgi:hypothetical protein
MENIYISGIMGICGGGTYIGRGAVKIGGGATGGWNIVIGGMEGKEGGLVILGEAGSGVKIEGASTTGGVGMTIGAIAGDLGVRGFGTITGSSTTVMGGGIAGDLGVGGLGTSAMRGLEVVRVISTLGEEGGAILGIGLGAGTLGEVTSSQP